MTTTSFHTTWYSLAFYIKRKLVQEMATKTETAEQNSENLKINSNSELSNNKIEGTSNFTSCSVIEYNNKVFEIFSVRLFLLILCHLFFLQKNLPISSYPFVKGDFIIIR